MTNMYFVEKWGGKYMFLDELFNSLFSEDCFIVELIFISGCFRAPDKREY